jgi:hypothetical protein
MDDHLKALEQRYTEAHALHGDSPRAVLYSVAKSQTDRFEILSKVADYRGSTVLDVGSGLGDLWPFLKQRHGMFTYTGLELVASTHRVAAGRHPDAEFVHGTLDSLTPGRTWDFVLESGIFNTSEYQWSTMEATVRNMWARCRVAVICNFLSCLSTGQSNADSAYYHPGDLLKLAAQLTRRFSLLHTYRDNDFTLILFRDERHPGTDGKPQFMPAHLVRRPESV